MLCQLDMLVLGLARALSLALAMALVTVASRCCFGAGPRLQSFLRQSAGECLVRSVFQQTRKRPHLCCNSSSSSFLLRDVRRSFQCPLRRNWMRRATSSRASYDEGNGDSRQHNVSSNKMLTLPTILTLARVVAVPVLVVVFFSNQSWTSLASTGIFVAASVTDWLDGYLARKMKLSSAFGAFLDPVADKLMVASALILLCTKPLAAAWFTDMPWLLPLPTVLIIGREITVSAVREWAATQGGDFRKVVAVDKLGKLKTATQMVALTLLLAFGDARDGVEAYLGAVGVGLLYLSAGLAVWSLSGYSKRLWRKL